MSFWKQANDNCLKLVPAKRAAAEERERSVYGHDPTSPFREKSSARESSLQEGRVATGGHTGQEACLLLHPQEEGNLLGTGGARLPWDPPEGHGRVCGRVLGAHSHKGGCCLHVGSRPDRLRCCCSDGPRTSGNRQANRHSHGNPHQQIQRTHLPRFASRQFHDSRHVVTPHRL